MASVQDLITSALRLLGVYGATETPEDEDLADSLAAFNALLDSWNAQHLTLYTTANRVLPLTGGTGTYTIGSGGTFAYPRPVKIESAGLVRANGVRSDMQLDTSATWASISEKGVAGKLPIRVYCDYAYPLATVRLWPVPSENCTLDVYVWQGLTVPMVLDDVFDLPPAYGRAVLYNLSVSIAPEYGLDPGPVILGIAQQSKNEVMSLNASTFAGTLEPPPAPAPSA